VNLRAIVAHSVTGAERHAKVSDLSLSGVSLTLPGALTPGDRVTVSFMAPSLWDPLALPARVAWQRPAREPGLVTAGLAFEPRDASALFALFELVSTVA
jgi:hypothetical protein